LVIATYDRPATTKRPVPSTGRPLQAPKAGAADRYKVAGGQPFRRTRPDIL